MAVDIDVCIHNLFKTVNSFQTINQFAHRKNVREEYLKFLTWKKRTEE